MERSSCDTRWDKPGATRGVAWARNVLRHGVWPLHLRLQALVEGAQQVPDVAAHGRLGHAKQHRRLAQLGVLRPHVQHEQGAVHKVELRGASAAAMRHAEVSVGVATLLDPRPQLPREVHHVRLVQQEHAVEHGVSRPPPKPRVRRATAGGEAHPRSRVAAPRVAVEVALPPLQQLSLLLLPHPAHTLLCAESEHVAVRHTPGKQQRRQGQHGTLVGIVHHRNMGGDVDGALGARGAAPTTHWVTCGTTEVAPFVRVSTPA